MLTAGVEHGQQGTPQGHLAGQGISGIAEIAEVLPVQVIDPGVHRLVEEGSARRRRLLDWGVFHVEHEFLGHWRRYQRALHSATPRSERSGDEQLIGCLGARARCRPGIDVDRLRS